MTSGPVHSVDPEFIAKKRAEGEELAKIWTPPAGPDLRDNRDPQGPELQAEVTQALKEIRARKS